MTTKERLIAFAFAIAIVALLFYRLDTDTATERQNNRDNTATSQCLQMGGNVHLAWTGERMKLAGCDIQAQVR